MYTGAKQIQGLDDRRALYPAGSKRILIKRSEYTIKHLSCSWAGDSITFPGDSHLYRFGKCSRVNFLFWPSETLAIEPARGA